MTDKQREWTVMIYMAGDNNLSEECVYSLTQIKESLKDIPELSVIAQFDPSGVRAETKRYDLTHAHTLTKDAESTGWKALETNTGEPLNLLDFIRWGISDYKAARYMVVLVGHGSGTDDDFLLRDENPPDSLSILELRDVFETITRDGNRIDILGMDTCLMSMAEVCYELKRTNLTYLVGSEGFSPNTGWPYATIIAKLTAKILLGGATPKWLAELITEEYKNFYVPYINGGISVDQSVLEIGKIDPVSDAVRDLVDKLRAEIKANELDYLKPKQNALLLAHWETQSYNGEVFVDLYDFCDRLELRYKLIPDSGEVPAACRAVKRAIGDLVTKGCYAGAAFQFSFGVSIYFPWAFQSPTYSNLSFPKETHWLDFLKDYHDVTRRKPPRCRDVRDTGRASVPTNKGRDGRVESMRNPSNAECVQCYEFTTETVKSRKRPASKPPKGTKRAKTG